MKASLEQDKKHRQFFVNNEIRKLYYKFMMLNDLLNFNSKLFYQKKISLFSSKSSIAKIKNRCLLTGRGHGVFRFFGLSRISFRELASKGALAGIKKKTW